MSVTTIIAGAITFIFGLLMVILFPTTRYQQPDRMALGGILFGLLLMAIGILLIRL